MGRYNAHLIRAVEKLRREGREGSPEFEAAAEEVNLSMAACSHPEIHHRTRHPAVPPHIRRWCTLCSDTLERSDR